MAFLLVIVMDVDDGDSLDDRAGSLDDIVDFIIVRILHSSLGNYSQMVGYVGEFGYGTLTARYRVDCDENFYGEGIANSSNIYQCIFNHSVGRMPPLLTLSFTQYTPNSQAKELQ